MKRHRTIVLWTALLLIVTASGTVLTACGKSKSNPMSPTPGGGATVTINIVANNFANSFSPASAACKVGDTVAWHNADSQAHTATSGVGDPAAFDTDGIAAGATSAPITMTTTGTYHYHCRFHTSMTGTLTVNPNP